MPYNIKMRCEHFMFILAGVYYVYYIHFKTFKFTFKFSFCLNVNLPIWILDLVHRIMLRSRCWFFVDNVSWNMHLLSSAVLLAVFMLNLNFLEKFVESFWRLWQHTNKIKCKLVLLFSKTAWIELYHIIGIISCSKFFCHANNVKLPICSSIHTQISFIDNHFVFTCFFANSAVTSVSSSIPNQPTTDAMLYIMKKHVQNACNFWVIVP